MLDGDDANIFFETTPLDTVFTVQQLHDPAAHSYMFRVAGRTSAGHGVFSQAVVWTPSKGGNTRSICRPPSVTIQGVERTNITLSVSPPADIELNGNSLKQIVVSITPLENSNLDPIESPVVRTISVSPSDFERGITIDELLPYTVYSISAQARSKMNTTSPSSYPEMVRTLEGIPTAVQSLLAEARETKLEVMWAAPVPAHGQVTYKLAVTPAAPGVPDLVDSENITLHGLQAVSVYLQHLFRCQ